MIEELEGIGKDYKIRIYELKMENKIFQKTN